MTSDTTCPPASTAAMNTLLGRASGLRRRGGRRGRAAASLIETTAARLFELFVEVHLGTSARARGRRGCVQSGG
jgi:hypothetical protein